MSSGNLTDPNELVTKQMLNDYHETILPYLGGMPSMVANKFDKGDLYSTDERMIGQWIDGKPIYQKTIILPNMININTPDGVTITSVSQYNIESLVDYVYYGLPENDDISTKIYQRVAFPVETRLDAANQTLIAAVSANNIWICALTIQYTKTTDSAISIGSDTDYSTDEKIIGTWIDGKPLYQKTWVFDSAINIQSNAWLDVSLDISVSEIEYFISGFAIGDPDGWDISPTYPVYVSAANNGIKILQTRNNGLNIKYLTLQYTKTTN